MARNLDMRALLSAIDRRDFSFYETLQPEARKEFVYSVIMRWAHEVSDAYILRFNERVNQFGDLMWKHPDLAYVMMASCGNGRTQRHNYIAAPKKEKEDTTLLDFIAIDWPGINQIEADILLSQLDKNSFADLVYGSILSMDDQKKVIAAYGKKRKK